MTTADVLLSDGGLAVVRTLRPDDAEAVHALHEGVSDEALWMRFFSVARGAAHHYVDHVLTSPETLALVAEVDGSIVALATAEPIAEHVCEVAFLVDDSHRGQGLGTLLLEHLAAEARDKGFGQFEARVLPANAHMLNVFTDAGFHIDRSRDGDDVLLRVDTAVTPEVQAAADRREFAAESHSLTPLLAPSGVVLYGARRDGSGIGSAVLSAIQQGGYGGTLAVVHPATPELPGVQVRATARDVTGPVDLAVIAVPAEAAVAALEDAASAGIHAVVVISSGFGEMGAEGAALQHQLAIAGRRHGIRMVGPNCLGMVCNDAEIRLNATFGGPVPPPGGLAIASQSGGVGIALMDLVATAGIGVRYFVSLGNKADVSGNDLLAAWLDDPDVTCGALYLESFGNARKFARFARAFSERKPLVAVVGGRSAGGRRAGASHTAAAASPAAGVEALFAQAGVIACNDAEELAETALLLTREPLPRGPRVALLSNAGGLGVLAADVAEDTGLQVVEFSADLQQRLGGLVNQTLGTANPVDAGAGAGPDQIAELATAVLASGEADALVAVLVTTGLQPDGASASARALADVRRAHPGVPLLVVPLGGAASDHGDVTVFRSSAAALGALGRAVRYSAWRGTRPGDVEATDALTAYEARATALRLLDAASDDGWVASKAARELLGRYDVELVGRFAAGAAEAGLVASEIGFPVAVKLGEADVVHKTEHGMVRTGLGSADQVFSAVAGFERLEGRPCSVLVQPMASGVEIVLGLIRDPAFGPMVMIGAGGVATDVWDDRAFLLPPFGEAEALRVLRSLRLWPLLEGFRGTPPAATGQLARLATRLGQLAVDVPEVAELDLNPVMVGPDHCTVVDAKLRLAPAGTAGTDQPRQLRRT